MSLAATPLISNLDRRPQLEIARVKPRHVNFLELARELSADAQLREALRIPGTALLGVATDGVPLMIRLASPDVTHVLISGAKASGKTQLVRTILASLTLYQKPRDVQLLVLDPQNAGFEFLGPLPHLLGEIATNGELALRHMRWLENELERRSAVHVTTPRLVVAIDDLAEWVREAGREFQVHLARLAQSGRRVGISLIVCSAQANASDVNATIRANFPIRLLGKNSGSNPGADKLAGRGDFILTAGGERVRFQAAYLAPEDVPDLQAQVQAQLQKPAAESVLSGFVKRLKRG